MRRPPAPAPCARARALALMAFLPLGCHTAAPATTDGEQVFEWHAGLGAAGRALHGVVTSSFGNRYQIEATVGQHDGKQLPLAVRATLARNASGAQVVGHCLAPAQLATQPASVWSSHCEVQEITQEERWFRRVSRQNRQVLRVHGDGRIELEPPP